jgi:hypothetical protein
MADGSLWIDRQVSIAGQYQGRPNGEGFGHVRERVAATAFSRVGFRECCRNFTLRLDASLFREIKKTGHLLTMGLEQQPAVTSRL